MTKDELERAIQELYNNTEAGDLNSFRSGFAACIGYCCTRFDSIGEIRQVYSDIVSADSKVGRS